MRNEPVLFERRREARPAAERKDVFIFPSDDSPRLIIALHRPLSYIKTNNIYIKRNI